MGFIRCGTNIAGNWLNRSHISDFLYIGVCVGGWGGDGDQEEALAGKGNFDMKKIATDDMVGRGSNGHKFGLLRNHCEKMMEESMPEHKEEDEVFKKPKTPKKGREKKVGIS